MFSTFRVAAVASLAIFAQVSYAAQCTRTYTVKEGDICDSISAANNVSTYQLGAVNAGKINAACSNLIPGDSICLGTEGQDCTTTYKVVSGDTCSGIWNNHRINSTILTANNPQINAECTNIYIGEVLCVAGSVAAPEVPSVPFHTGPPAGEAVTVPASPTSGVVVVTDAVAPTAATTLVIPPANAAPTPAPSFGGEDDLECEEDEEEWEVVYGEGNEDLPFCDEV